MALRMQILSVISLFLAFNYAESRPTKPTGAKLTITVTAKLGAANATATVATGPKGIAALVGGEAMTVNGVRLVAKPIDKTRAWNFAEIPVAKTYDFKLQHSNGSVDSPITVPAREFVPNIPGVLSKAKDFVIPFSGPSFSSREKIQVKIVADKAIFGSRRKAVVVTAVLDGKKIIVSASSFQNFSPGRATMHITISSDESQPKLDHKLIYVVSAEHSIEIAKSAP